MIRQAITMEVLGKAVANEHRKKKFPGLIFGGGGGYDKNKGAKSSSSTYFILI
jgi:hypothetical protein